MLGLSGKIAFDGIIDLYENLDSDSKYILEFGLTVLRDNCKDIEMARFLDVLLENMWNGRK